MNPLLIKIMAVGLTLSQLFTKPVEQFKDKFDAQADGPQVQQILHDGCGYIVKEFNAQNIDFDFLFNMMVENMKSTREKPVDSGVEGDTPAPTAAPEAQNSSSDKITSQNITSQLDIPAFYAAYKQFCKNDTSDSASLPLTEVIEYYNKTLAHLPDARKLVGARLPGSTLILDRNGNPFTEIYSDNNRRKWVKIKSLPDYVSKAFVSAEDNRFYEHHGVDVRGVLRAFATSVSSKARPQGGSTITQQVVKNLMVGEDLTFERKMREMVMAARLEKVLTKDEILELYINMVFLGRASWGVEVAAQSYFGKAARELTIAEAASLASLPRGPNYYNPDLHADRWQDRRQYVLTHMRDDGYLKESDAQVATKATVTTVAFTPPMARGAFYALDEIQREARRTGRLKSLTSDSYLVRSTLDPKLQLSAENALADGLHGYEVLAKRSGAHFQVEGSLAHDIERYHGHWQDLLSKTHGPLYDVHWPLATVTRTDGGVMVGFADGRTLPVIDTSANILSKLKLYDLVFVRPNAAGRLATAATILPRPQVQGSVVVMEAKTGRILAMSGGFSYAQSQLNRVTRAPRQPGSTLKPFIYLSALNLKFQPNTLLPDTRITLKPIDPHGQSWSPHNFDGISGGTVTMRQAVEMSMNVPTVHMMENLGRSPTDGLDYIRGISQEMGLYENPIRFYPFVLGAQPTHLIDLAAAYAAIANLGGRPKPHLIDTIERDGEIVLPPRRFDLTASSSVDQVAFYQLRRILEGVVARGTAVAMKDLAGYVAGKTGTSNNSNDAWFVAFTNDLVVGAWVGYDNSHIAPSLGDGMTGGMVALPIVSQILRDSFKLYKPMEALSGPPPGIQGQFVDLEINYKNGMIGDGNFVETFRKERTASQPTDTRNAVLHIGEDILSVRSLTPGDVEQTALFTDDLGLQYQIEKTIARQEQADTEDAYVPGANDLYDLWNKRNRQVDLDALATLFPNPSL